VPAIIGEVGYSDSLQDTRSRVESWLRRFGGDVRPNVMSILTSQIPVGVVIKVEMTNNQLSMLQVEYYEWVAGDRRTGLSPSGPVCLARHVSLF
jgi:hypothetical protein